MTQREIVRRLDDIHVRLDEVAIEINRAECIWELLPTPENADFIPRWLSAPHSEHAAPITEYRQLSRQHRHQARLPNR
jgi:hypothetical protein